MGWVISEPAKLALRDCLPSFRRKQNVPPLPPKNVEIRHEVAFYRGDAAFVDDFAHLMEAALEAGSAVILIVTEVHRADLLQRLRADGMAVDAASKQGSYRKFALINSDRVYVVTPIVQKCQDFPGEIIAPCPIMADERTVSLW